MALFKAKGKWRYEFEIEGKRYTKTGFLTKTEAKAAMEMRKKQIKETFLPLPEGSDLLTTMAKYLESAEKRLAPKTFEYRKIVYRRFLQHIGNVPLKQISPQAIESYLNNRPTNNNFNKDRTELHVLFNWAMKRCLLDRNPCFPIERLPVEQTRKVIPTPEEMLRILGASGTYRPFLMVVFHTLARVDEIHRLRWDDISFEQRIVKLWSRKSRHGNLVSRDIPMSDMLYEVLWGLWKKRSDNELVFPSPSGGIYIYRRKMMGRICARAGVRKFGFHAIRHWVASYLYDKKKVSLAVVSKLLGHSNFQTTERYLQLIDPRLRDAITHLDDGFLREEIAEIL
jgi:integrase